MQSMRFPTLTSLVSGALLTAACGSPAEPARFDPLSPDGLATGVIATVRWNGLEGGFWAVQVTDGRILDPHETLPEAYRVEGLRVHVRAEPLADVLCFHQAGLIVAITEIHAR